MFSSFTKHEGHVTLRPSARKLYFARRWLVCSYMICTCHVVSTSKHKPFLMSRGTEQQCDSSEHGLKKKKSSAHDIKILPFRIRVNLLSKALSLSRLFLRRNGRWVLIWGPGFQPWSASLCCGLGLITWYPKSSFRVPKEEKYS